VPTNHLPPVLLISPDGAAHASADAALHQLGDALQALGYRVVRARTTDDGLTLVKSQPAFAAVVLDWDLGDGKRCPREAALAIIHGVRARSQLMPVFLAVGPTSPAALPLSVAREVNGYLHPLAELPEMTAQRLDFAMRQYFAALLPPYLRALRELVDDGPNVWGGSGHQQGDVYRRHPVGAEFQRLFGDGLARADVGGGVPELGDWLEHRGAPADSERRAARVFGSDWSYFVLGSASAANRIVINGVVARDDIVLVDRSAHVSLLHGLMLAGARPVYLKPACNRYGLIGPIPPWCLAPGHLRELIDHSPLARGGSSPNPALATITNSTPDGLCVDVERLVSTVSPIVPRVHFDEAAYGHAHIHPIYDGRHAMGVVGDVPDRPTLFAAQSAHDMLPALSMAGMIHVRSGTRAPVVAHAFDQSFRMHGTASPLGAILASADVATAMMEAPAGRALLDEAIRDAIGFRQSVAATRARFLEGRGSDTWFFDVFQPAQVVHPSGGPAMPFAEAPADLLAEHSSCWTLRPGEAWHGFPDIDVELGYVLLDPMKVTLTCPGVDARGEMSAQGIPACLLTRFLAERRIYVARSGAYTALVQFSIGSDTGRWGAVIETLHEFKRFYDSGVTVGEALPRLVAAHPRYTNLTLRRLCDSMHAAMTALGLLRLERDAMTADPVPAITPAAAYQELLRGRTEAVPLCAAKGRIAAAAVTRGASGIPVVLPGERLATSENAALHYLQSLEAFDTTFPGFESAVHGVERGDDGTVLLRVVSDERRRHTSPPPRAVVDEGRR
jgi:arginine decarboxylase